MGGILATVSAALSALKEWLGLRSKEVDNKNTEAMKKASALAKEAAEKDRAREAIRKRDLDELREDLAE